MRSGSSAIVLAAAVGVVFLVAGAPVSADQGFFSSEGDGSVWIVGDDDGAYLGVRLREETDHPEGGARVTRVLEDSPASRAGVKEGDIILQFDDEVIRGPASLTKRIRSRQAGDTVALTVRRDGREQVLDVELGARAEGLFSGPRTFSLESGDWQGLEEDLAERLAEVGERLGKDGEWRWQFDPGQRFEVAPRVRGFFGRPRLGVQLIETTPELRRHLGGDTDAGVLVSKVLSGTPAEHAGVAVGDLIVDVDGESIASAGDLVEALADRVGETFEITVIRDHDRESIEVTLPAVDDEPVTGPRARAPRRPRTPARLIVPLPDAVAPAPAPVMAPGPRVVPTPVRPPAPPAPPAPPGGRRFV